MTCFLLMLAHLKDASIPSCHTSRRSQVRSWVRRWSFFTLILLAALGAPQLCMAQIYVTTPHQDNTDPTKCSVREAIYATEFGGNIAIGSTDPDTTYNTGCTDASGTWNNIVLQSGTTYSFSRFWDGDAHNPFGPTAAPIIFKTISIEGNGAALVWTGAGNSRLFAVGFASITPTAGVVTGTTYSGTGKLTLRHVYIRGFHVKGGDGAGGGGGGLGAGGAIYVGKIPGSADSPSLTVENSTFDNNGASGGNGGSGLAGGGGGLNGNGGEGLGAGGGGGGARGNGGNSGDASTCTPGFACDQGGGGGGGTGFSGGNGGDTGGAGAGGLYCGGTGGDSLSDGHSASCPGGGGGGGGHTLETGASGNGGNGNYGGGGGGGSGTSGGGNGDVGGGGGGAGGDTPEVGVGCGRGGRGGFGGGGAGHGDPSCLTGGSDGSGGAFAGKGSGFDGGGGAALGGAIFNDSGIVEVQNSTFINNSVGHGFAGGGSAEPGTDAGGAIFSRNGSTTIQDVTISGNQATGAGGGVEVKEDGSTTTFLLQNTIIAGNGNNECIVSGSVGTDGSRSNLIVNNIGCPNVAVMSDPMLDSLKLNLPGDTPTLALLSGSPAIGAGDPSLNAILPTDQRGLLRKDAPDIGAFESVPLADLSLTKTVSPSRAKAGNTVTYTLTLSNLGPDTANDITVADAVPDVLTSVSCSASGGAACATQGAIQLVTYSTLAANSPQTITIKGTVKAGSSRGTVTNQASASDASPVDPDPSNNSSAASFTLLVPDFSVTAGSPITIVVGGSGTSTVTVGSIDTFSSAVTLTASGPSGFQESFSSNPVTPSSDSSKSSTLTISLGPSVTAGSYTVHVTGTSGALTHTTSVIVNVKATIAGITNVIGSFRTVGAIDNSGISNSLTGKLAEAQTYVSSGDNQTATNILSAMDNEINAQSGKHVTSSAAAALITDTQALQGSLSANLSSDPVMGYVVNSSNMPIAGAAVNVLDPSGAVVATATTDSTGFYFFPLTSRWTLGQSYAVKATLPKGYKASTPTSQNFAWQASQLVLSSFVIN